MAEETRFKLRGEELAWREVDDEIVVLDLRSSRYLSVNSSGAVLWPHLADGATETQLVGVLVDRFDIDADTASKDVGHFLQMCRQRDLVDAAGASS